MNSLRVSHAVLHICIGVHSVRCANPPASQGGVFLQSVPKRFGRRPEESVEAKQLVLAVPSTYKNTHIVLEVFPIAH